MAERRRRHRGEDSTYRVCADRWGCPPAVELPTPSGGTVRRRPEHGKSCRAPWAYAIDRGMVAGRRERTVVTAKTKAALLKKIDSAKTKLAMGVVPDAATVGEWLEYWIATVAPARLRPTTVRSYDSKIRTYLIPALGTTVLQDLRPDHIERMHDWMRTLDKSRGGKGRGEGPLSDTTIRQAHLILQSALADALARRKVTYNAAAVVRAPKATGRTHDRLDLDQAKAVLRAAADERDLCRFVVALALGLRQGEALGLRWAQDYVTDGTDRYLVIEEAIQRDHGRLDRAPVKSRASHRRVPIPERMVPIFEAWRKRATDAYLFPGPAGGPCDSKADWQAWTDALARADVPHVPLHGARGSAASLLADMGVPDWRIAEILGHSQVATTRRHYIAGTDASHRTAIEGLLGELLP